MKPKKTPTLPAKYKHGFLHDLDGRIAIAQHLKQAYREICEDCGGEESLSHVKRAMAERFCWLEAVLRGLERQMVDADPKDAAASGQLLSRWVQSLNSFVGLGKTLGLERRTRKLADLTTYAARKS